MNDLRIIKALNDQSLTGVEFGCGEPVLIIRHRLQPVEAVVEKNEPDSKYLVAGGISFHKETGYSTGELYPVKIQALNKRPRTLSSEYETGKHITGSQLASQRA